VLYLTGRAGDDPDVAALGKITTGKGCIYVKRLADIDLARFKTLVERGMRDDTPEW
jgi:hypothetical protein